MGVESEFGQKFDPFELDTEGIFMAKSAAAKTLFRGLSNGFHQGWCNSSEIVNEALQGHQFVLVSDPFTKDSDDPAEPNFCLRNQCNIRATQLESLSAIF